MPNVKMTETRMGCDDGIHAAEFLAGETYCVGEALAAAFVADGVAVDVGAPKAAVPVPVAPDKTTAQAPPNRRKKASGK